MTIVLRQPANHREDLGHPPFVVEPRRDVLGEVTIGVPFSR
ncbi:MULTISPECIES: hypothetical protein [Micromonospora]|nr:MULTISPECIES: hypothetical protein [Micromonospora]